MERVCILARVRSDKMAGRNGASLAERTACPDQGFRRIAEIFHLD